VVHSSLLSEQAKINHDIRGFQFYPILSLVFGFRFK
jgi:hypothetical protein